MNLPANPFVSLRAGTTTALAQDDRFEAAGHMWSQPEIDALILAHAARRPLLVRGESGSGKSQLARAAAAVRGGQAPLVEVIHPRFEALDLLYKFDAVARLSDAQLRGDDGKSMLDATNRRYVRPGVLWRAYEPAAGAASKLVVLIDEIDKADADVPNSLLEVLGNRSFDVPHLEHRTIRAGAGSMPLIVITTNEERELPAAFVRRCVVLNLNPPEDELRFMDWLRKRGQSHTRLADVDKGVAQAAAKQVLDDRKAAVKAGYPKVGLAEYIDLLAALQELTEGVPAQQRVAKQGEWLKRLSAYALVKNAGQDQSRPAVAVAAGSSRTA